MNPVLQAIATRHCKRRFLQKPVSRRLIEDVLIAASNAASSKNSQPWEVVVCMGESLASLSALLCEKFDRGEFETPDYTGMPTPLPAVFLERARACAFELFKVKGIEKDDAEARRKHSRENFEFFAAPIAIFFFLPLNAERGSFLDLGQFLQNVMLGVQSLGLGSCPQASLTAYSKTIRERVNKPESVFVCGLAVGYPDPDAAVNSFFPARAQLSDYATFLD